MSCQALPVKEGCCVRMACLHPCVSEWTDQQSFYMSKLLLKCRLDIDQANIRSAKSLCARNADRNNMPSQSSTCGS